MKLTLSNVDTADIIHIEGRVDAGTSKELETAVMELVKTGSGPLVLDFGEVDYISSAGLRVLLVGLKALSAGGRRLALASLNPDVMDVVKLTGFDKLLDCHDGLDSAVAASVS